MLSYTREVRQRSRRLESESSSPGGGNRPQTEGETSAAAAVEQIRGATANYSGIEQFTGAQPHNKLKVTMLLPFVSIKTGGLIVTVLGASRQSYFLCIFSFSQISSSTPLMSLQ